MRYALVGLLGGLLAAPAAARQLEDRPQPLEPKLLSAEQLQQAQDRTRQREAQALYGLAVARERNERLLEAMQLYEQARALDPASTAIPRAMIPLCVSLGRDAQALELCRHVLQSDPQDSTVAFQFARRLKLAGKQAESIAALRQALESPRIAARPDQQFWVRQELCEQLRRQGDAAAEALAWQQLLDLIETRTPEIVQASGELQKDDLFRSRLDGYERLGRAALRARNFDLSRKAFQIARQLLIDSGEEGSSDAAQRIHWHLCEVATAQGRDADALRHLDAYLAKPRVSLEPYERKVALTRKLQGDAAAVRAARTLAEDQPENVALQALLARELSASQPAEAERLYRSLAAQHLRADLYRGLFTLLRATNRMEQVLTLIDETLETLRSKEKSAEERDQAGERYRVMVGVLREDAELVQGLLAAAATELKNFQFGRKKQLDTWEFLARLAASTRQLDRAEAFFKQSLQAANPFQRDEIHMGLLEVLRLGHRWQEVIDLCTQLLKRTARDKNPTDAAFRVDLAVALGEVGRVDESIRQFDLAVEQAPSDPWKLSIREQKVRMLSHAGRDREAFAECERLLQEYKLPGEQRQVRLVLATAYGLAGKHADAERQLELLLEADPNDVLANNNLGYQWAERGIKLDEAEKRIRRALELDGLQKSADTRDDNPAYLDSLGWVLFRKGKLEEALGVLQRASRHPDGALDGAVWDHLGDAYFKLQRPDDARHAWQQALQRFENDARSRREGRLEDVKKKLDLLKK